MNMKESLMRKIILLVTIAYLSIGAVGEMTRLFILWNKMFEFGSYIYVEIILYWLAWLAVLIIFWKSKP